MHGWDRRKRDGSVKSPDTRTMEGSVLNGSFDMDGSRIGEVMKKGNNL